MCLLAPVLLASIASGWLVGTSNGQTATCYKGGSGNVAVCARTDSDPDCVCFPSGDVSFADRVIRYLPPGACHDCYGGGLLYRCGDPASEHQFRDWSTGRPDRDGDYGYVSLGNGGLLEVAFVDNLLTNSGNADPDLFVFETGPAVEACFVAVRPQDAGTRGLLEGAGRQDQGDGFFRVGRIGGALSKLDLDAWVPGLAAGALRFDAVQIIDDFTDGSGCSASGGADIDAVGAISSLPANRAPIADAGPDIAAECTGPSGTTVQLDGGRSSDPDQDALTYTWTGPFAEGGGTVTGATVSVTLPLGSHDVALVVSDGTVDSPPDVLTVHIVDTRAPSLGLTLSRRVLWPPNHRLVPVEVVAQAADACDASPAIRLVDVRSSEPDNGLGDGDREHDIQGAQMGEADFDLLLRAERSGGGHGRLYSVCYQVRDGSGNALSECQSVVVPHDQNGRAVLLQGARGRMLAVLGLAEMPAHSVARGSVWVGDLEDFAVAAAPEPVLVNDLDGDLVPDAGFGFAEREAVELERRITSSGPLYAWWTAGDHVHLAKLDGDRVADVPDGGRDRIGAWLEPNPFVGSTRLGFRLAGPSVVSLGFYDMTGRRVRTLLLSASLEQGDHEFRWDGRDDQAQPLPAGVYFSRLEIDGSVHHRRIVFLR